MDGLHPLTLRFTTDDLEQAWRTLRARESLRPFRATTALAIALYVGFIILDQALLEDVAWRLLFVRVVVCVLLTGVLVLTWTSAWGRFDNGIVAGAVLLSGGGILALLAVGGEEAHLHWAGLMLAQMAIYGLFRPRLPVSVAISFALIVAFNAIVIPAGMIPVAIIVVDNFFLVSAALVGCLASYSLERSSRERFLMTRNLDNERRLSDQLLLNILPEPIARRLKAGEERIADQHAEVTVLFADIANFTAMTAHMEPIELVQLLDDVFQDFDSVAREHGIEKVKTIGDACMMVAGLPEAQDDHVGRIADAALDMRERVASCRSVNGQPIRLHIGIATGSVVAGVIGRTKFSYDLWGDVVNTASRMATLAERGRIQVTKEVVQALGDRYTFRPRGVIDVKGKGWMETWYLESRGAPELEEAESRNLFELLRASAANED